MDLPPMGLQDGQVSSPIDGVEGQSPLAICLPAGLLRLLDDDSLGEGLVLAFQVGVHAIMLSCAARGP